MGTRAVIARPKGDGFEGRYHHWDGYPSGLGRTLWRLQDAATLGNTQGMIAYLIDEETVGWSTINGADWSMPKGWRDSHDRDAACADCTLPMWRHYAQYYPESTDPADPMVNGARRRGLIKPGEVLQLGHGHRAMVVPTGPQSYSARGETGDQMITSDGDDGGAEWAYVITPHALIVFERRYGAIGADEGHGTGMLGMGASDTESGGYWAPVAECRWDDVEPDWDALDQGASVSA